MTNSTQKRTEFVNMNDPIVGVLCHRLHLRFEGDHRRRRSENLGKGTGWGGLTRSGRGTPRVNRTKSPIVSTIIMWLTLDKSVVRVILLGPPKEARIFHCLPTPFKFQDNTWYFCRTQLQKTGGNILFISFFPPHPVSVENNMGFGHVPLLMD